MNRTAYVIVAKERYVTILSCISKISLREMLSDELDRAELFGNRETAGECAEKLRKRYPRTKFEVRRVVLK